MSEKALAVSVDAFGVAGEALKVGGGFGGCLRLWEGFVNLDTLGVNLVALRGNLDAHGANLDALVRKRSVLCLTVQCSQIFQCILAVNAVGLD